MQVSLASRLVLADGHPGGPGGQVVPRPVRPDLQVVLVAIGVVGLVGAVVGVGQGRAKTPGVLHSSLG